MIYPFLKKSLFILKIPFKITCTPGHGQIHHYKEIPNQKLRSLNGLQRYGTNVKAILPYNVEQLHQFLILNRYLTKKYS